MDHQSFSLQLGTYMGMKTEEMTTILTTSSYSTIMLYSKDHKGVGMAHKITSPQKQPDNNEAVLVR